jgi:hypothetical protein
MGKRFFAFDSLQNVSVSELHRFTGNQQKTCDLPILKGKKGTLYSTRWCRVLKQILPKVSSGIVTPMAIHKLSSDTFYGFFLKRGKHLIKPYDLESL